MGIISPLLNSSQVILQVSCLSKKKKIERSAQPTGLVYDFFTTYLEYSRVKSQLIIGWNFHLPPPKNS